MKKILSILCCTALFLSLTGCSKKESLDENESTTHSIHSIGADGSGISSENIESSESSETVTPAFPETELQKISKLREDIENQINTVKNTKYTNLNITDEFVVKVPETDMLYDLTLTTPAPDFETFYEKFDKTFDKEFGDIYTQEDKEKIYHVFTWDMTGEVYNTDGTLLVTHLDKLLSGEEIFHEIYVDTEKAYLAMFSFGNGIYGLNHDKMIRRAEPDKEPKYVSLTFATNYFETVKNYLDFDTEDKFALLDKEVSIKEAVETAKKLTAENEYSWGGSLEPDVYQVKVLDIGEGKYGLSFTMAPSYKGVLISVAELFKDSGLNIRTKKLDHDYEIFSPTAFMMEDGKFDSFTGGDSKFTAAETAEYDSVIPLDKVVQYVSEKFGFGMNLSVTRIELMYSAIYPVTKNDRTVMKTFPVWKFKCYNKTDNLIYNIFVNAVNGNIEYYTTDWWES